MRTHACGWRIQKRSGPGRVQGRRPSRLHVLFERWVLQGVSAIAAGGNHAFALTNNNTVLAWGENADQLGDGTSDTRLTPVNVCSAGATAPCSIAYGNVLQWLSGIVAGEGSTGDGGFGRFLELFVTVTRRDEPVLPLQLRFVRSIVVTGESFY